MNEEMARIIEKLFAEASERITVASEILQAHGLKPISENRIRVQFYDGDMPYNCERIEYLARLLGEEVTTLNETENSVWVGFVMNGVTYFTLRDKEKEDGRN